MIDVLIVGAGVAGCATAIALKNIMPNLDICILDREQLNSLKIESHEQCYAKLIRPKIGETLPPSVMIPLQQLGLWEEFLAASFIKCSGTSSSWGASTLYTNEHIFSAYGNGWHLDRQQFDNLLLTAARKQKIRMIKSAQFLKISKQQHGWSLVFQTKEQSNLQQQYIEAKFVIDASGRSARVAQQIGVKKQIHDHLLGIYRFYNQNKEKLSHATVVDSSTLIESAEQGWWYSASLPKQKHVVALMTDVDIAQVKAYRQSTHFDQALAETQQIVGRLEGLTADNKPIVCAAQTQCLEQLAGKGWLAVGDAAFTFDPLSSLGIFKALRMSLYASYAVKDFFHAKDSELVKYQKVAKAEFNNYLKKRKEYYAEETRYSKQPFWARRLAA